jgi:hypothetical protein
MKKLMLGWPGIEMPTKILKRGYAADPHGSVGRNRCASPEAPAD